MAALTRAAPWTTPGRVESVVRGVTRPERRASVRRMKALRSVIAGTACAAALAALVGCNDVPRLQLAAEIPDPDLKLATQQLLFIAREPPATGGNPCSVLWSEPPTELAQLARLIDYPNAQDVVAAPLDVGNYTVFVYALSSRFDRLCATDADCADSAVGPSCRALEGGQKACFADTTSVRTLAGGCGEGIISSTIAYSLALELGPPPNK